jgi:hypothetical protein
MILLFLTVFIHVSRVSIFFLKVFRFVSLVEILQILVESIVESVFLAAHAREQGADSLVDGAGHSLATDCTFHHAAVLNLGLTVLAEEFQDLLSTLGHW